MYNGKEKSDDYIVCLCKKTTLGEVKQAIKENNITNLKELCAVADTGNKCGGCREELEEILNNEIASI